MSIFNTNLADLVGILLGFTFTIFVFSYAWGDNPIFRITAHIFVGVAAGYATVITIYNILIPQLITPLFSDNRGELILAVLYLIPSALLLTKISPQLSNIGNPAMAILVGIGAATAVGGAVTGTLSSQVAASTHIFRDHNFINAVIILIGTLATLIYFQFGVSKNRDQTSVKAGLIQGISWIGKTFIAITFGALFAGVYFAALTALIERISFLWMIIREMVIPAFLG
jgi:hypothetical protein